MTEDCRDCEGVGLAPIDGPDATPVKCQSCDGTGCVELEERDVA